MTRYFLANKGYNTASYQKVFSPAAMAMETLLYYTRNNMFVFACEKCRRGMVADHTLEWGHGSTLM